MIRDAIQRAFNAACDPVHCPANTQCSALVLWLLMAMCCFAVGGVFFVLSPEAMLYFVFAWVCTAVGVCLLVMLCMDALAKPVS